jgi:hypothetical protein
VRASPDASAVLTGYTCITKDSCRCCHHQKCCLYHLQHTLVAMHSQSSRLWCLHDSTTQANTAHTHLACLVPNWAAWLQTALLTQCIGVPLRLLQAVHCVHARVCVSVRACVRACVCRCTMRQHKAIRRKWAPSLPLPCVDVPLGLWSCILQYRYNGELEIIAAKEPSGEYSLT